MRVIQAVIGTLAVAATVALGAGPTLADSKMEDAIKADAEEKATT